MSRAGEALDGSQIEGVESGSQKGIVTGELELVDQILSEERLGDPVEVQKADLGLAWEALIRQERQGVKGIVPAAVEVREPDQRIKIPDDLLCMVLRKPGDLLTPLFPGR